MNALVVGWIVSGVFAVADWVVQYLDSWYSVRAVALGASEQNPKLVSAVKSGSVARVLAAKLPLSFFADLWAAAIPFGGALIYAIIISKVWPAMKTSRATYHTLANIHKNGA